MLTVTRRVGGLCAAALLFMALTATPADASHFRFGKIECQPTGNAGEVSCEVTVAFRRSFFGAANAGDMVFIGGSANFSWGDGTPTETFSVLVSSASPAQDLFIGSVTLTHTYATSGTYSVGFDSCCRIGQLRNRANASYEVFGILDVDVSGANAIDPNPITSVAPVTGFPKSATAGVPATKTIPVADPNGESVICEQAPPTAVGGGAAAPGLTVNPDCTIDWDNNMLPNGLYTLQIRIIEVDAAGNRSGNVTVVDYILDLGVDSGTAPICTFDVASPLVVQTGGAVSFTVTGTDADAGDTIELSAVTVPAFGVMSPALPISGTAPQASTFSGTAPGTPGTAFATYSVTDNAGNTASCDLTIQYVDGQGPTDTTAPVCGAITIDRSTGNGIVMTTATDDTGIVKATFTTLTNLVGQLSEGGGTPFGAFNQGDVYDFATPQASIGIQAERVDPNQSGAAIVVRVEDAAGNFALCDPVIALLGAAPEQLTLGQNQPNPMTGTTSIPFGLAEAGHVHLAVYDVVGREVAVLVDQTMGAGTYDISWDGTDAFGRALSPGTYIYRLSAGPHALTRRMTIVR